LAGHNGSLASPGSHWLAVTTMVRVFRVQQYLPNLQGHPLCENWPFAASGRVAEPQRASFLTLLNCLPPTRRLRWVVPPARPYPVGRVPLGPPESCFNQTCSWPRPSTAILHHHAVIRPCPEPRADAGVMPGLKYNIADRRVGEGERILYPRCRAARSDHRPHASTSPGRIRSTCLRAGADVLRITSRPMIHAKGVLW